MKKTMIERFPYELNKTRVKKEASYNIWRGIAIAVFSGFAIAVILIFALVPTAAQAFDDITVGMNTIFILILVTCSGIAWYFINRSAK
jgi:uncharacterized BrkB/YihY/UPF0761 family membrane protein